MSYGHSRKASTRILDSPWPIEPPDVIYQDLLNKPLNIPITLFLWALWLFMPIRTSSYNENSIHHSPMSWTSICPYLHLSSVNLFVVVCRLTNQNWLSVCRAEFFFHFKLYNVLTHFYLFTARDRSLVMYVGSKNCSL